MAEQTQLGRYTLLEPLGQGGMAQVFIAQRQGAEDICVLKQLHSELASLSEVARRFQREAHIAAFLDHPNIARVIDAGIEDGRFCIAMEFIAGETLEAIVNAARKRGGPPPLEITIAVALMALDALAYAHTLTDPDGRPLQLVHRDLSPRNVMVSYDGRVKLIDFGIAKGNVDEFKTAAGVLMGTPYYMSPEQARALEVDQKSDLYTFAAVLFELLVGRRLVTVKGRANILLSVVRDLPPPPSSLNPKVPAALDAVIQKALSKSLDGRYPSAAELAAALRAASPAPASQEVIARYVKTIFPEGERRAHELRMLAHTRKETSAPNEATRVAPSSLASQPDRDGTPVGYADTRLVDSTPTSTPFISMVPAPHRRWASRAPLLILGLLIAAVGWLGYDRLSRPIALPTDRKHTPVAPALPHASRARAEPKAVTAAARPVAHAPVSAEPAATLAQDSPETIRPRPTRSADEAEEARRGRPPPAARRPAEAIAPPPPVEASPEPAKPGLLGRLARLRTTRAKAEAFQLAKELQEAAERLPDDSPYKRRVRAEADRVFLTGDVDAMIEALQGALDDLQRARGSSR